MRNPKMVNRIAALFALFIILFQTFAFPVAAAQPWSGKSWEGDSWEGDSWQGDTWEGDTWGGDSWTNDSWEGKTWNGNSWESNSWNQHPGQGGNSWSGSDFNGRDFNGSDFNGSDFNGSDFSGSDFNGSDFNGTDFNGSNFNGNPWNNPGYNGNPWNAPGNNGGNPWDHPGYNGSPWSPSGPGGGGGAGAIPGFNGSPINPGMPLLPGGDFSTVSPPKPTAYDITKMVGNDVIAGQIKMIGAYTEQGATGFGTSGNFMTGLFINGVKTGLGGDKAPWYAHAAADGKTAYDMGKGAFEAGKTLSNLQRGTQLGDVAARGASTMNTVGSISKFSAVGAGISAGFTAYDTGVNTLKAIDTWKSDASTGQKVAATADATASFGETLFNVGAVASAVPGGQALGAGLMIAGGVVWGASKVTKFFADGSAKKVWNKTKDTFNKAKNFIGGLFGK